MAPISAARNTQLLLLTSSLNPTPDAGTSESLSKPQSSSVEASSSRTDITVLLAELYFYGGDFESALHLCRSAYESATTDEGKCISSGELARVLFVMENFSEAETYIEIQEKFFKGLRKRGKTNLVQILQADYYANKIDLLINKLQKEGYRSFKTVNPEHEEQIKALKAELDSIGLSLESNEQEFSSSSVDVEFLGYIRFTHLQGKFYHLLEETKQASIYFSKNHSLMTGLSTKVPENYQRAFSLIFIDTLECLGFVSQIMKEYKKAVQYFTEAIRLSTQVDLPHAQATHYLYRGVCRYQLLSPMRYARNIVQRINISEGIDRINALYGFNTNNAAKQAQVDSSLEQQESEDLDNIIQDLKTAINLFSKIEDNFTTAPNKIKYNNLHDHAWIMLENCLYNEKRHENAFEIALQRPARALLATLIPPLSVVSNNQLNSSQVRELAKNLKTTFIIYSLAPSLGNPSAKPDEQKLRVWVVSAGKIETTELPLNSLIDKTAKFAIRMLKVTVDLRKNLWEEVRKRKKDANSLDFPIDDFIDNPHIDVSLNLRPILKVRKRLMKEINRVKRLMEDFYNTLIKPISDHLPPKKTSITIIAERCLGHIPFAALREGKASNYLIEDYVLSNIPSVQLLDRLYRQEQARLKEQALIITDPTSDLTYALEEARTLEKCFQVKTLEVTNLKQQDATKDKVSEKLTRSNYTFVHFSCHGSEKANHSESVFKGALKLANNLKNDEFLYSEEIVKMHMKTELVFLNTCCSALGQIHQEGNVGLTWAFLSAGARATITCLWPLYDSRLIVQMIHNIYKLVLEGKSSATALHEASLQRIKKERERPDKWGLFLHSGLDHQISLAH